MQSKKISNDQELIQSVSIKPTPPTIHVQIFSRLKDVTPIIRCIELVTILVIEIL